MICEVSYKLCVTTNRAWLVCAFNQEKALVGAFSVTVKSFEALDCAGCCAVVPLWPHLTKHMDSLAPPTQPTSPEKNKLKPRVMTE